MLWVMKRYLFDLDNTLCETNKGKDGNWDYLNAVPFTDRIKIVNNLFDQGNYIIIETARGCVSKINWYEETYNQLVSFGLKFHELRTGVKFNFDYSIDDKGINSDDFFQNKKHFITDPIELTKKINLFCEIFIEKNEERLKEYVYCINKNISNTSIKNIFLVCYQKTYDENIEYFQKFFTEQILPNNKIKLILNSEEFRFTFNKFVEYSNIYLNKGEIVAVSNLDIFFPDDYYWRNIDKDFFIPTKNTCCLSLSRTEYINDNYTFIDEGAWDRGEFADAWIFKTPLRLSNSSFPFKIPVGSAPTCDNFMFYILNQEYEMTFNWAEKYRIYHYDICRKPETLKTKSGEMILHDDVVELDVNWLHQKPEEKYRVYPKNNWNKLFNNKKHDLIFSTMNETTINLNNIEYNFLYYDFFDDYYYNNGRGVEPQTRRWFTEVLKPDDIIFDIGAHIGLYTTLFSTITNNVYSFEPTSTYENLLLPNLEKNNIKNVNTYKLAFGLNKGIFNEKIYKIWGQSPFEDEYEFTTLDDFIDSTGIKPTFLKIDVDGFDYEVLLGGNNFFKQNSATICVEVNDGLNTRGHNPSELIKYMTDLGYSVKNIFDNENYIFQKS